MSISRAALALSTITALTFTAIALAGQRGANSNFFHAEVAVIANDEIVSTTIRYEDDIEDVEYRGGLAGLNEEQKKALAKEHKAVFKTAPQASAANEFPFSGAATVSVLARAKKSTVVEGDAAEEFRFKYNMIPTVIVTYKLKDGGECVTRASMSPTRVAN